MFDNDLFISYSHIDNRPLGPGQEAWVSRFHTALEVRLSQLLGRDLRLWRDPKLQGNDDFAEEIAERFSNVAALVCVLSPRYVRSEWCLREVQEFCRVCEGSGGVRVDGKARVFKVVKTPIPREQHPPEVQATLGYEFFEVDQSTGRAWEFGLPGSESEGLYWAKLEDLAQELSQLLEAMERRTTSTVVATPPPAAKPDEGQAIYLAETTSDLHQARDRIRRELLQHGHTVLPEQDLPLVSDDLQQLLTSTLERCCLSIHLLGRHYGVVPEGETRSVVELQNEMAITRAAGPDFERLVWIHPEVEVEDERQQQLIRALETDPLSQAGADIFTVQLEAFKSAIHDKLRAQQATDARPARASEGPRQVYLICDQRDAEAAVRLEDLLFDQGFEVTLPLFEGDESEVRHDHEENLRLCDAALIYYGNAREAWLRAKLRELKKIVGYGRRTPVDTKAVLVADPPSPRKERFRTREALVVRLAGEPRLEALGGLLDALTTGTSG